MKKNLLKGSFVSLVAFSPFLVLAAGTTPPAVVTGSGCTTSSGLCGVVSTIGSLFGFILPVLVALGVVYFVWGVIMYVIADGEEAKKKGRDSMIYGIIGLAVIIGLWGLVTIVLTTFGLNAGGSNAGSQSTVNSQINQLLPTQVTQ